MTPKEKAESLLTMMEAQTYKYKPYAGATPLEAEVGYEAGRKCALLAVDEIIGLLTNYINPLVNCWFEVQQEIENLYQRRR